MIERARKERKPDQANFIQPIVGLRPFNANLEYRAAGINAPASTHDKDAELFNVVEGRNDSDGGHAERRAPHQSRQPDRYGDRRRDVAQAGERRLGDGAEKTPHWFTQVEGALVLMSIHLPRE